MPPPRCVAIYKKENDARWPRYMTPAEFVQVTLRKIRTDFFAQVSDKRFFQEQALLKQAVTFPARWLKDRGSHNVTIGLMRKILSTVIGTINKHGNRANIGRFSVYFLHCVQVHMSHHGDEYLQEAKGVPHISKFMRRAVSDLKAKVGSPDPGAVLAETNRVLGRGRRRIRKGRDVDLATDLFGTCSDGAMTPQKPGNFLKPVQYRPSGAIFPQTGRTPSGDS